MKRIFQRKARLACPISDAATASKSDERISVDASGSSRKSVTMIGIALSVAASGLVIHQQDDQALAADHQVSLPSLAKAGAEPSPSEVGEVNHVVREGDTIWSIADRYQVSTGELISTNVLSSEEVLRVGQALNIPVEIERQSVPQVPSPVVSSDSSSQAINRNLAHLQIQKASQSLETDNLSEVSETRDSSESEVSTHRVPRSGAISQSSIDRLRNRREELRERMAELQASKPTAILPETVEVNQSDDVTAADSSQQSDSSSTRLSAALPDAGDRLNSSAVHYETQLGETIESIALNSGVDLQAIIEVNGLSDPDDIRAGQVLLLPTDGQSTAQVSPSSEVVADARQSNSDLASSDGSVQVSALQDENSSSVDWSSEQPTTHQLRPGETLAQISRQYGISLQELIEQNSIRNPNRVFAGRVLNIPTSSQQSAITVPSRPTVQSASETLVGYATAPGSQFSVTDVPDLISAPVVPLPSGMAPESLDEEQSTVEEISDDAVAANRDSASVEEVAQPTQGNNVYVEGLLNEIRAIENSSRSSSSNSSTEIDSRAATGVAPDVSYLQDGDAVNAEFEQSSRSGDRSEPTSQPTSEQPLSPSEQETSPTLVAAAPLGSENYVPLGQPATGRVVSPELPPLPGADNYIPSGSATFNGYLWPARGVFTSGYGWRWGRMHRGIDIAAPVGTPIYAAAPGVIEFSGWNSGGYGNLVDIRHPDGSKTRYAHNSRLLVRSGQTVTQGQQIAEMGSTGFSTGPHVHFEIHVPNQGAVNPVALLQER